MNTKQAKTELQQILQQKTVSVARLKRVLHVLDYKRFERDNQRLRKKIKKLKG